MELSGITQAILPSLAAGLDSLQKRQISFPHWELNLRSFITQSSDNNYQVSVHSVIMMAQSLLLVKYLNNCKTCRTHTLNTKCAKMSLSKSCTNTGSAEAWLHSFLTLARHRRERSYSHTRYFATGERTQGTQWIRGRLTKFAHSILTSINIKLQLRCM
jgi:hypothetical protein